ncbi:4355_t:CDS:2, partial [Entrophospora sp. SA101]
MQKMIEQELLQQATDKWAEIKNKDPNELIKSLDIISELLLHPKLTLKIAESLRPILIDLVSRWSLQLNIDNYNNTKSNQLFSNKEYFLRIEKVALAFTQLLPITPQLLSIAISFFSTSPSLLERLNYLHEENSSSIKDLQLLLVTIYRLLKFSVSSFVHLWNWTPLFQLLLHSDNTIRYLTILCLSIVYNMSVTQQEIALEYWTCSSKSHHIINYLELENGEIIDVRMLRLFDEISNAKKQHSLLLDCENNNNN